MAATIVFDTEELKEYAARAGLGLQFVTKEAFLFELVDLLDGEGLVLKGGTAINKGYLEGHQRFSEDLDYDTDEEKATVKKIVKGIDWKIKKEFFTKNALGFLLAYDFSGVKDVLKVDFSFGIKGAAEEWRLVSDFLPVSKRTTMYGFTELNMQKELAFEGRAEWKDLYDLYWMSELYPQRFRINSTSKFSSALQRLSVPKTANAFIPRQKRVNWNMVKEKMGNV